MVKGAIKCPIGVMVEHHWVQTPLLLIGHIKVTALASESRFLNQAYNIYLAG
jgi:hypothetical protein